MNDDLITVQIDYARWVLQNCTTGIVDAVTLENIQAKKLCKDNQTVFYLDSDSDMNKLYSIYKENIAQQGVDK